MKIHPLASKSITADVAVEFECPWCPHTWKGSVRLNIHNYDRSDIGPVTHLAVPIANTRIINEHKCPGPSWARAQSPATPTAWRPITEHEQEESPNEYPSLRRLLTGADRRLPM